MSSNTSERTTVISDQTNTENSQPKTSSSSKGELVLIVVGVIFVVLLWLGYPFLLNLLDSTKQNQPQIVIPYQIDAMLKTEPEQSETIDEEKTKFQKIGDTYGTYGDSYGSLNTLFSGLAFTFLVASLFLQRKELHAQRLEIEDQKDEIRKSNEIADEQRQIAANQEILISNQLSEGQKQNFYILLFKLLDEKNLRFSRLIIKSKRPNEYHDLIGDAFIKVFSISLSNGIKDLDITINYEEAQKKTIQQVLSHRYAIETATHNTCFEDYSYFEYIVSILDFIQKNSTYNSDGSITNIFLSSLTIHETICMAYYAVIKDNTSLKQYIEIYGLLRNIDSFNMSGFSKNYLKILYDEQAFIAPRKATLDFLFESNTSPTT
ncbi:hypothetical protein DCO44_09905 [Acinetobacter sp. AM]|uniref:putative phage abortive infection protein n=1 Tax=Acinetobacter sp. AM TaxID=2170730 RepID=UPI000DE6C3A0|nr:putative phage abortive infection protein [Acinetobacter sp. AM]PWB14217.1 hypothetical protein DCO44_09905 [Acinetobacter sp. AM]